MKTKLCCLWMCLMAGVMASCCHTEFSQSLLKTCEYWPEWKEEVPLTVYRKGEQYYLCCDVVYKCEHDKVRCASIIDPPDNVLHTEIPVNVKRKRVEKRYYCLMGAEAVQKLLGVKPLPAPGDCPICIPADEWNAADAVPVTVKLSPKKAWLWDGDDVCQYNKWDRSKPYEVYVPEYTPWDYWIKAPLSAVLLVAVDVPCTIVWNVGVAIYATIPAEF